MSYSLSKENHEILHPLYGVKNLNLKTTGSISTHTRLPFQHRRADHWTSDTHREL